MAVRHLDTKSFDEAIAAYANHIKTFEGIVKDVNNAANMAVENWKGKGAKAFEKDAKQVQLCLKDITSIMQNISDALANAYEEYKRADAEAAQAMESR